MPIDRSKFRNVHIYDASKLEQPAIGGLRQNGLITKAAFLDMVAIIVTTQPSLYSIFHRKSGSLTQRSPEVLELGEYEIRSQVPIIITSEVALLRFYTKEHTNATPREEKFKTDIRSRDGKCVLTGTPNEMIEINHWGWFEAAHIFPLAFNEVFISKGLSALISKKPSGERAINSCQNGLLLTSNVHNPWDSFEISVNPDDGYKIICFSKVSPSPLLHSLDPVCRNPNDDRHVQDGILRWHFRQAVLANVKGNGMPVLEHDFPDGEDMLSEILSEPLAKERLEFEIFTRLSGYEEREDNELTADESGEDNYGSQSRPSAPRNLENLSTKDEDEGPHGPHRACQTPLLADSSVAESYGEPKSSEVPLLSEEPIVSEEPAVSRELLVSDSEEQLIPKTVTASKGSAPSTE